MNPLRNPQVLASALERHLSRSVGKIAAVYPCPGPTLIHARVFHIPQTSTRNRHLLVTCGMSQRPMCPPPEMPDARYAEIYLSLPADWPLGPETFVGRRVTWPVDALGELARLPHEEEGWLWESHTVGAPDPNEEIAPGIGFTAWVIGSHGSLGHRTCAPRILGSPLRIFSALPIYPEELELAWKRGSSALFDRMERAGIDELVRIGRPNLARRAR